MIGNAGLLDRLKARNANRPEREFKDDDDGFLLRQQARSEASMREFEEEYREHDDADEAPAKRRRMRKPSLVSVAKQAAKAGLEVARYEIEPDGKISVVTGKPDDVETANPWDVVLSNVAN